MKLQVVKKYKETDIRKFYTLMSCVGFLLYLLEDFEETPWFKQAIKFNANKLYKELDKLEGAVSIEARKKIVESGEGDSYDYGTAMEQMMDSYQYFENWFNVIFEVDYTKHQELDGMIEACVDYFKGETKDIARLNVLSMLHNSTKYGG